MKEKALLAILLLLAAHASAQTTNPGKVYMLKGEVNSISVAEGLVCAASEDSNVYIFDEYLRLKWRYEYSDKVTAVSSSGDVVVFGALDDMLVALDISGGEPQPRWKASIESYIEYPHAIDSRGDLISAGTRGGYLYLFSVDGEILWKEKTDAYIVYVRILDGYVAAVTDKGVYFYNMEGEITYHEELDSYVRAAHISEKHIVVGMGDNRLSVYDLEGKRLFTREQEDQIGAVYASDQEVVVGLRDKRMLVYSFSGEEKLEKQLSDAVIGVAEKNGQILASTLDGRLHLYSTNGLKKWDYEAKGRTHEVAMSNIGIYSGTTRGEVYYFRAARDIKSTAVVLSALVVVIIAAFLLLLKTLR